MTTNKEPLITTDYCVDEVLTLLIARKRSALALPTGWRIFNEDLCDLHFLTPDQVLGIGLFFRPSIARLELHRLHEQGAD